VNNFFKIGNNFTLNGIESLKEGLIKNEFLKEIYFFEFGFLNNGFIFEKIFSYNYTLEKIKYGSTKDILVRNNNLHHFGFQIYLDYDINFIF
jgi:hypothetical protein